MRLSRRPAWNRAQIKGLLLALLLTFGILSKPILAGVNTWTRIGPDADPWIVSIELDRQNPDSIFAIQWTDGRAILRSLDRGESWQRVPISAGPQGTLLSLVDLASDPLVSGSLYGLAQGYVLSSELLSSRDGGETWTHALLSPLPCHSGADLAVDPFDSDRVFVSGQRELGQGCESQCAGWRTDNAGESWRCIGPADSPLGIRKVAPSPFTPGLLLGIGSGRIHRSSDSGDTWAGVDSSLGGNGLPYVLDAAWATPESAYAATAGGGLYSSHDAGLSWARVIPSSEVDYPWIIGEIIVDPFDPLRVFVLSAVHLFDAPTRVLHSADGGLTWEAREAGLSGQWLHDLVLDPVTPNRLYVSADSTGLLAYDFEEPSSCGASATELCLGDGRFRIQSLWRDFDGNSGSGQAKPLSNESGAFWFFDEDNLELFVKELDGQKTNGAFWTFYGALTNVEFSLLVTDTETGAMHGYFNPRTRFASVGDMESFPQGETAAVGASVATVSPGARPAFAPATVEGACVESSTTLCLQLGRFAVTVEWTDFEGESGVGYAIAMTPDTGSFWFFEEGIHELAVKVIDGLGTNGSFWVYYASLSNVEFDVTVTDSVTGDLWTRRNPAGTFASGGDIEAFPQLP